MNRLNEIFKNQRRLMNTLIPVELEIDKNIYVPKTFPIDLHDRAHQRYLRELGNRFIEELGEAIEASKKSEQRDFEEELIDVLHFLTEISIVVDFNPVDFINENYSIDKFTSVLHEDDLEYFFDLTNHFYLPIEKESDIYMGLLEQYGKVMSCLRSKPWKRNYTETDTRLFYFELSYLWRWFFHLLIFNGLTPETTWEIYVSKNKINFERQENGY